jgi:hypothetical protein
MLLTMLRDVDVLSSSTIPIGRWRICPSPKMVAMKKIRNNGNTTAAPK